MFARSISRYSRIAFILRTDLIYGKKKFSFLLVRIISIIKPSLQCIVKNIDFFFAIALKALKSNSITMSSPKTVKNDFLDLNKVVGLSAGIKAWFLMFRMFVSFAPELGGLKIRSEYDETFDMDQFNKLFGGKEKAEKCSRCERVLEDEIHKMRGTCGKCNHETLGSVRQNVRQRSWVEWNGKNSTGSCFCCKAVIQRNKFEAAHITAAYYGGEAKSYNIRPTCHACNRAMGPTNLRIFSEELVKIDKVLQKDKKFEDAVNAKWAGLARKRKRSKHTLSG